MDSELSFHKAAVLIASLDVDTADLLLAQMPDHQADEVRNEVFRLGEPNPAEQQAVIDEFFRIGPLPSGQPSPDSELEEAVWIRETQSDDEYQNERAQHSARLIMETRSANSLHDSQRSGQPFSFLHSTDPELLVSLLEREHPQSIALVLAHLPRDRAGHLLARLPAPMQSDVVRRLVDLQEIDQAIVRDIEMAVETWLKERQSERRTVGMEAVAAILSASDYASRRQILNNLAVHDRPLAHRLTPPPKIQHFTFSEVCRFPPEALVCVVRAVDRRTAVLALAGAPEEVVEQLFDELRPEEADWISHGLAHLGPLRLADFDRAQEEIAKSAEQLYMQGHLPGLDTQHLTAVA